jgi:preprotein translocase subunit SecF
MNIIKYKKFFLLFSALVLVPGIIVLALWGLKLSIDFTGGSLLTYKFDQIVDTGQLQKVLDDNGAGVEVISFNAENVYSIRTRPIDPQNIDKIKEAVSKDFQDAQLRSFETVGPVIGKETTKNAVKSLAWASIGILLYIAYAFRNIPKPFSSFRFGVSAIIAMLHDAFVVLGIFAILGHFFNIEIDVLFITAMLTVIGFSVHDTIVVFDRIRENLNKLPKSMSFESVVNFSLVETLNRSIATSMTVLITLLALYLLGGESIKNFVLAMLIGIFSGTYSSIFTASPLLVLWEEFNDKRRHKRV